jgi:glycosyltransferase involved in cell wall biosynthesis
MRIAQIAPVARPVSSASTGSIEQVVFLLTEELVARGHEVTLFATGESETSAELRSIYRLGHDDDPELWEWSFHEQMHVASAFEQAAEFDVIHSHVYHFALPFTRLVATPTVHTYHVFPDDHIARAYATYPEAHLVAISAFQQQRLNGAGLGPVIHHGVDVDRFPFSADPGDYLVFLGKLDYVKGPVEAATVAARAGMPLVIAGHGDDWWRDRVTSEPGVTYVGWVEAERRNQLLAGAAALVYPLNVPETFGLVMVEAMACGTPVLALDRGAVTEIVENGVTGFYADGLDALAELVPEAVALDRRRVRARAMERFGHSRMADEYEALYRRVAR